MEPGIEFEEPQFIKKKRLEKQEKQEKLEKERKEQEQRKIKRKKMLEYLQKKKEQERLQKQILKAEDLKDSQQIKEQKKQWNEQYEREKKQSQQFRKLIMTQGEELANKKENQNQFFKRQEEISVTKEKLKGNSTIWVFVAHKSILDKYEKQINLIYGKGDDGDQSQNLVPKCYNVSELKNYLTIERAHFKIVADLQNIEGVIEFCENNRQTKRRVAEYYILAQKNAEESKELEKTELLNLASEVKRKYIKYKNKIKRYFYQLDQILQEVTEELMNQINLKKSINSEESYYENTEKQKFSAFCRLDPEERNDQENQNDEDKTIEDYFVNPDSKNITEYRRNLYAAKNMSDYDRVYEFMNYMRYLYDVESKNVHKQKDKKDFEEEVKNYQALIHCEGKFTKDRSQKVLKFYTKPSFYYKSLNLLLRLGRDYRDYHNWALPFNETYRSIEFFHKQKKGKIQPMETYRGMSYLKDEDIKKLKEGAYIETYGFQSTSKKKKVAYQFADKKRIIFKFIIPRMEVPEDLQAFDHGFADLQPFTDVKGEEEILLNAMNVFKLVKIEHQIFKGEKWTFYHFQYGAIISLIKKRRQMSEKNINTLTPAEQYLLLNYRACTEMEKSMDTSKVLFLNGQFDEAKRVLEERIKKKKKNNEETISDRNELANIQREDGRLQNAEKIIEELLQQVSEDITQETAAKVYSSHVVAAEIKKELEDYDGAKKIHEKSIQVLGMRKNITNEQMKKLGKSWRQKGQIQFKKGDIHQAEESFKKSEEVYNELLQKYEEEKSSQKRQGFFLSIKQIFGCVGTEEVQNFEGRRNKLKGQISLVAEQKNPIYQEIKKIIKSMMNVAIYVEDKDKYLEYVEKGRKQIWKNKFREAKTFEEKAELKVFQATVSSYFTLAQSEKLMEDAIKLIEKGKKDENHPLVGEYSKKLAEIQKKQLQKDSNPKNSFQKRAQQIDKGDEDEKVEIQKYDHKQHEKIYAKARKNFQRAIKIKGENVGEETKDLMEIRNQLGDLHYNEANFTECEKVISEVNKQKMNSEQIQKLLQQVEKEKQQQGEKSVRVNEEVSRSSLILAKIAYSRGQLKLAFINLGESNILLKEALRRNKEETIQKSEIYIEIMIWKSQTYLRQLQHDTCLKELEYVEKILKLKFIDQETHSAFCDMYQIRGKALLKLPQKDQNQWKKNYKQGKKLLTKSVDLRKKQLGKYNYLVATAYCMIAHTLIEDLDPKEVKSYIQIAAEILSTFAPNNPLLWSVYFCYSKLQEKKGRLQESAQLMKNCLNLTEIKFDKSHVTIPTVKYSYAEILHKKGKNSNNQDDIRQSEKIINQLSSSLKGFINESNTRISKNMKKNIEEIEDKNDFKTKLEQRINKLQSEIGASLKPNPS